MGYSHTIVPTGHKQSPCQLHASRTFLSLRAGLLNSPTSVFPLGAFPIFTATGTAVSTTHKLDVAAHTFTHDAHVLRALQLACTNLFPIYLGGVTEILVRQKFWSGGPKFPENLVRRTIIFRKYWSACGIMVRAQILRCKHFNDTSLFQSVCIVSKSLKKSFGKQNKLLKPLNSCKYRVVCFN